MRLIDANKLQQRIIDEKDEIITDNHHAIGMHNGLTLAQAMIINAPTIEVPRLIPVAERLPEKAGEYLVAYYPCYWEHIHHDTILIGLDTFRGKTAWAKRKHQKVTHWMPLPQPPKDGE
jgi:hypothetical protein